MLKSRAPPIAASLIQLFNMLIATGCFPKLDWKCTRVTPISDPSLLKNYQSISIVTKLLEHHVQC